MESRAFYKYSTKLMAKIATIKAPNFTEVELHQMRIDTQKDLNQLFAGLQNPTLPSAYKLRNVAVAAGFTVDAKVQHRLQQAEGMWV